MWQTKYASAVPKNLGVGVSFGPCSEDYFLSWRPQSVSILIGQPKLFLFHKVQKIGLSYRFLFRKQICSVNKKAEIVNLRVRRPKQPTDYSNFFQDGSLAWEALDYLLNEERVTDVQLEQKTYHGYHTEEGKKEKAEKEAKIKKDKKKSKKKVKKEPKKKKDEL